LTDLSECEYIADEILLGRLWDWGHFRNPAYQQCRNVSSREEAIKLSMDHGLAHDAVRSYQEFFAVELDRASRIFHHRALIADGAVGPATEWLVKQPRCGVPEFSGTEEANWPDSCRREITVSWDFDQLAIDSGVIRQAWELALKSWEDVVDLKFSIQPVFSQQTRIWATDGPLPGSTLAWSELAQSNCAATLEQRYDTLVSWNLTFLRSTICHEVGHALGCQHLRTQQSIMYPSITDVVVPQTADVAQMVQLGYRRREGPPPPPPPPPPNGGNTVKGLFVGQIDGQIIKT